MVCNMCAAMLTGLLYGNSVMQFNTETTHTVGAYCGDCSTEHTGGFILSAIV